MPASAAAAEAPPRAEDFYVLPRCSVYSTPVSGTQARLLQLHGPRGGQCAGQVVIDLGRQPPKQLDLSVSDLKQPGGAGVISKEQVQVRYATNHRDLARPEARELGRQPDWSVLSEEYLAEDGPLPLWITVRIPAQAMPGTYEGLLAVQGRRVPLRVNVSAFLMPPREERSVLLHLVNSPDSVALRYGVAPYSERHFQLLERSFALQGRAANNVLSVPVIGNTWEGARTGVIQFRREGEGWAPDFRVFERYLQAYLKYNVPPRFLILRVWDLYLSVPECALRGKLRVTERTADGTFAPLELDAYPAHKELWKAVVDGAAACMKRAGLAPETLRLGTLADLHAAKETGAMFREIAPGVTWAAWTHGFDYVPRDAALAAGASGLPVTYLEMPFFSPLNGAVRGGWEARDVHWTTTLRATLPVQDLTARRAPQHLWLYAPDLSVGKAWSLAGTSHARRGLQFEPSNCSGLGRLGLDFWPLPSTAEKIGHPWRLWFSFPVDPGRDGWYCYSHIDRGQAMHAFSAAGPAGALATAEFEVLLEGLQLAEARVCIERAIAAGRAPKDLAERYAALGAYPERKSFVNESGADPAVILTDSAVLAQLPGDRYDKILDLAGQMIERLRN